MLTIGDRFPDFTLTAVHPGNGNPDEDFVTVTNDTYAGKWLVVFYWPKDFTFVCPTEIVGFGELNDAFHGLGAQVLGASTDSDYVHLAWRESRPDLKASPFPWLSDIKKELANALGIVHPDEGVALRATFIVDPEGVIRWVSVNDLAVGRDPAEVVRVLEALQTKKLTPCSWAPGQPTLS